MLPVLRTLIGARAEAASDEILLYCLDDCMELALRYCSIEELPDGLARVVIDMAADKYRLSGYGRAEPVRGAVTQIREGEQSVSFGGAAALDASGLLKNYAARLNAYRRLRWG